MSPKQAFQKTPVIGNYQGTVTSYQSRQSIGIDSYYSTPWSLISDSQETTNQSGYFADYSNNATSYGHGPCIDTFDDDPTKNLFLQDGNSQSKKSDNLSPVAIGFGGELNFFNFSINIGNYYSKNGSGIGTLTFGSGPSSSVNANLYFGIVRGRNSFNLRTMSGPGGEWSIGYKAFGFSRGADNLATPTYTVSQVNYGVGIFNKSAGIVNTNTFTWFFINMFTLDRTFF